MRELKYAALLHDFGKVGVRESVLVKEKKLRAGSLENIQYRILLTKERLRTQALSKQLAMFRSGGFDESRFAEIDKQLVVDSDLLDEFYQSIIEVNEPSILNEENKEMLDKIKAYRLKTMDDEVHIITPEEFELLSIKKGSLSPTERKEIESHVVHTQNFLNHIPWTKEFQNIPTIAAAHHEKLDGSGYPYGMTDTEIPLPSKIMTICDIYDALTASDRPYKPAMPVEKAIDILKEESKRGLIDEDLVNVFVEAKIFHVIDSREYATSSEFESFSHHPCDHDLQEE